MVAFLWLSYNVYNFCLHSCYYVTRDYISTPDVPNVYSLLGAQQYIHSGQAVNFSTTDCSPVQNLSHHFLELLNDQNSKVN